MISGLNWINLNKFAVTLLLQDQWASLSLPADPGRLFPPVWRPQYTFLYCRVQKWVEGGWTPGVDDTKRKLYLRKKHDFVTEKYIEDVRQEEKDVPDLLEAIMRSTCPVKEELRQNLFKMTQFRPEIPKIRV